MPGVLTMVRERVLPFFEEYRESGAVNRGGDGHKTHAAGAADKSIACGCA
jgi:hypothetical protein